MCFDCRALPYLDDKVATGLMRGSDTPGPLCLEQDLSDEQKDIKAKARALRLKLLRLALRVGHTHRTGIVAQVSSVVCKSKDWSVVLHLQAWQSRAHRTMMRGFVRVLGPALMAYFRRSNASHVRV